MALLGGLGGGITRDILLGQVPSALTNPAYILLCLAAGIVGYRIAFAEGQLFREGLFQFMTSFSLPWYAIVGAQAGVEANIPILGSLLLAVVGPTAGRYYIDVTSGVPPKQFVRGEWFVAIATLTGAVWIACDAIGLGTWWSAGISFAIGFIVQSHRALQRLGGAAGEGTSRRVPARRRTTSARPQAERQVGAGDAGPRPHRRNRTPSAVIRRIGTLPEIWNRR